MDGLVENVGVDEGLVGEVMSLQVTSNDFDVVEFGRVIWAATRSPNSPWRTCARVNVDQ